jgi:hypothetical protein
VALLAATSLVACTPGSLEGESSSGSLTIVAPYRAKGLPPPDHGAKVSLICVEVPAGETPDENCSGLAEELRRVVIPGFNEQTANQRPIYPEVTTITLGALALPAPSLRDLCRNSAEGNQTSVNLAKTVLKAAGTVPGSLPIIYAAMPERQECEEGGVTLDDGAIIIFGPQQTPIDEQARVAAHELGHRELEAPHLSSTEDLNGDNDRCVQTAPGMFTGEDLVCQSADDLDWAAEYAGDGVMGSGPAVAETGDYIAGSEWYNGFTLAVAGILPKQNIKPLPYGGEARLINFVDQPSKGTLVILPLSVNSPLRPTMPWATNLIIEAGSNDYGDPAVSICAVGPLQKDPSGKRPFILQLPLAGADHEKVPNIGEGEFNPSFPVYSDDQYAIFVTSYNPKDGSFGVKVQGLINRQK